MNTANNTEVSKDSLDTTNICIKLRRLKIEENVISKSIRKTSDDFQGENFCCHEFYSSSFFKHLKDSIVEINKLFVDIKYHINSQSNLEIAGKLYFSISSSSYNLQLGSCRYTLLHFLLVCSRLFYILNLITVLLFLRGLARHEARQVRNDIEACT